MAFLAQKKYFNSHRVYDFWDNMGQRGQQGQR